jgi:hypothetical protein
LFFILIFFFTFFNLFKIHKRPPIVGRNFGAFSRRGWLLLLAVIIYRINIYNYIDACVDICKYICFAKEKNNFLIFYNICRHMNERWKETSL